MDRDSSESSSSRSDSQIALGMRTAEAQSGNTPGFFHSPEGITPYQDNHRVRQRSSSSSSDSSDYSSTSEYSNDSSDHRPRPQARRLFDDDQIEAVPPTPSNNSNMPPPPSRSSRVSSSSSSSSDIFIQNSIRATSPQAPGLQPNIRRLDTSHQSPSRNTDANESLSPMHTNTSAMGTLTNGGFFSQAQSPVENIEGGADWWKNQQPNSFAIENSSDSDSSTSTSKSKSKSRSRSRSSDYSSEQGHELQDLDEEQDPKQIAVDAFDPASLLEIRQTNKTNFLMKDKKAPLIWTIGFILISLLTTGLSFYYGGFKFQSMTVNPFFGVDETSMISFGAKYGPFISNGQWWRLLTANAIHAGVIQFVFCIAVHISLYIIERFKGFWSALLVFLLAGVYGYILSSMFIPEITACGSNGAEMGYIGWIFVEVLTSWRQTKRIGRLIATIIQIILFALIGLMPYNDNFCNVGGLIMGVLIGLTLMPNTAVHKWETAIRMVVAFLAFPIMATIFCICLVLYIRNVNAESLCSWCHSAACINLPFANWCPAPIGY